MECNHSTSHPVSVNKQVGNKQTLKSDIALLNALIASWSSLATASECEPVWLLIETKDLEIAANALINLTKPPNSVTFANFQQSHFSDSGATQTFCASRLAFAVFIQGFTSSYWLRETKLFLYIVSYSFAKAIQSKQLNKHNESLESWQPNHS